MLASEGLQLLSLRKILLHVLLIGRCSSREISLLLVIRKALSLILNRNILLCSTNWPCSRNCCLSCCQQIIIPITASKGQPSTSFQQLNLLRRRQKSFHVLNNHKYPQSRREGIRTSGWRSDKQGWRHRQIRTHCPNSHMAPLKLMLLFKSCPRNH